MTTKKPQKQPVAWPADAPERRKIDALVPYAKNSRTHTDEQIDQIVAAIKEWGWTNPVLVDEAGMIIAGHGRVLAAQRMGLDEIPVIVARGWSDHQKRAYVIADNQLALNAGWDEEILAAELGDLDAAGFDIELAGVGLVDLGEPELVDLTVPTDESRSGVNAPIIKIGSIKVNLSDEEMGALKGRLEEYIAERGVPHGFFASLLGV